MAVIANSGGMSPRFSPLLPFHPSKHSATFFLTQTRNEKKKSICHVNEPSDSEPRESFTVCFCCICSKHTDYITYFRLVACNECNDKIQLMWKFRSVCYRDVNTQFSCSVTLSCTACSCHPVGSVHSGGSTLCNPNTGECTCKPGVGGSYCDSCMTGYWGLNEYGCRPCDCTGDCDPYTGDCISG